MLLWWLLWEHGMSRMLSTSWEGAPFVLTCDLSSPNPWRLPETAFLLVTGLNQKSQDRCGSIWRPCPSLWVSGQEQWASVPPTGIFQPLLLARGRIAVLHFLRAIDDHATGFGQGNVFGYKPEETVHALPSPHTSMPEICWEDSAGLSPGE